MDSIIAAFIGSAAAVIIAVVGSYLSLSTRLARLEGAVAQLGIAYGVRRKNE
ncbi:MAG: hypothetical protein ACYCOR_19140 [Acidobacteriaceae bacterium]